LKEEPLRDHYLSPHVEFLEYRALRRRGQFVSA